MEQKQVNETVSNDNIQSQSQNVNENVATTNENTQVESKEITTVEGKEEGIKKEFTENESKQKQEQDLQTRAKYAQERREKQAKEKEQEELKHKIRLEIIREENNNINPYTDEPMETDEDTEEYLIMKEMEKKGLDPNSTKDYRKFTKEKELKKQEESKQEQFIRNSFNEFVTKYPQVNVKELFENEDFLDYAEGKQNTIPLATIYEKYTKKQASLEELIKKQVDNRLAKQLASPGSMTKNNQNTDESQARYTWEQIKTMTREEANKNWEKYNRDYQWHIKHKTYQK